MEAKSEERQFKTSRITTKNPFLRMYHAFMRVYMLYEIHTAVMFLDFWTKVVVNTIIFTICSVILYSTIVYLPPYVYTMLAFFTSFDTEPLVNSHADGGWKSAVGLFSCFEICHVLYLSLWNLGFEQLIMVSVPNIHTV